MTNNWSVYMHTTPSGKRYIGITSIDPEKRWNGGISGYKGQVFELAIKKYGWENIKHEVLFSGLSKEEASAKEKELIATYKTDKSSHGYNVSSGGVSEKAFSEHTKRQMSLSHADVSGNKNPRARKVMCLDTNEVFETIKEAASKYNVDPSCISDCCTGKHKTCLGLRFQYYDRGKPLKNRSKKPVHAMKPSNTSGYRGVVFDKSNKKWRAQLKHNYKNHYLGSFDTPELAYEARLKAEQEILGGTINEQHDRSIVRYGEI